MTCQRCKRTVDSLTRVHAPGRVAFEVDLCGSCLSEWDQVEAGLRQRAAAAHNIRVEWTWGTSSTSTTTGGW